MMQLCGGEKLADLANRVPFGNIITRQLIIDNTLYLSYVLYLQ